MKTIRCKFVCTSVTELPDGWIGSFMAVFGNSPENESFFKYTPSASLELKTIKENHFKPGKEYYLDITEAK
jgi:hypothetical protein